MKVSERLLPLASCLLSFTLVSCGYHVAGRADMLPKNIKTIAIPAFGNTTTRYRLGELLTGAIAREFISRTRYQIVAEPDQADAVLTGTVTSFVSYPTTYDPVTGRASAVQTIVLLAITLRDHATNAVLFDRPRMEFRQIYEISVDPQTYFDESGGAMDRLSSDVARSVVSAILEKF